MTNSTYRKRCILGIAKPDKRKIAKHYGVCQMTCMACGVEDIQTDRAHIMPLNQDGTNELENLHLLCKVCHAESEKLWGKEYEVWITLKKEFYTKGAYSAVNCVDAFNRFLLLDFIIRSAKKGSSALFEDKWKIPKEDALQDVLPFSMWRFLNKDLQESNCDA